ncbi:hypothetical protein DKP78_15995, partial [Enterococcus faecium]
YIGGLSQQLREKFNIQSQPLKGCVNSVKINNQHFAFNETVGVSKGCQDDFLAIREVECKAGGSLDTALDSFSLTGDVVLSLGFRSTEADGILLSKTEQGTGLRLSMVDGHVVMEFVNKIFKSTKQ